MQKEFSVDGLIRIAGSRVAVKVTSERPIRNAGAVIHRRLLTVAQAGEYLSRSPGGATSSHQCRRVASSSRSRAESPSLG
jgi:hypothetical protein